MTDRERGVLLCVGVHGLSRDSVRYSDTLARRSISRRNRLRRTKESATDKRVKKTITYSGNSFALILDKAVCRVLGIGHGSIVKLAIEDGRLIVERTNEHRIMAPGKKRLRCAPTGIVRDVGEPMIRAADKEYSLAALRKYSRGTVTALLDRGLDRHLDRVHYQAGLPATLFLRKFAFLNVEAAGARDVVVLRRLFAIFDEIEAGERMEDAIDVAIARYPFESSEAMSEGSGASAETRPPSG